MSTYLLELWTSIAPVHGQIYGLIFTLIGAFIFWLFRPKVKLIWGATNNSLNIVPLQDGNLELYVEKYFLQNVGKKPATDVEFILSYEPSSISVWQPRDYKAIKLSKGEFMIKVPNIAPGELVIFDCAYLNQKAAFVESVKCLEAVGKAVNFWTVRRHSNWLNFSILVIMVLGFAFIIQFILNIVAGVPT